MAEIKIVNVSSESDDEFVITNEKEYNIETIRIRCTLLRELPLIDTTLLGKPLAYYLQKHAYYM